MLERLQTPKTEYEVGTQFVFNGQEQPLNPVVEGLGRAIATIRLETRMLVFDALRGTNYRQIRHDLIREKKLKEFEAAIGLQRV